MKIQGVYHMRLPSFIISCLLLSVSPGFGFSLGGLVDDVKDEGEKAAHKIKHKGEEAVDDVEHAAKKALPTHVIKEIEKLHDAMRELNPGKIKHLITGKLKSAEEKMLKSAIDPEISKQLKLIIHDLKFIEKQGKELLSGQCGKQMFTEVIPAWFKKQVENLKEIFSLGKTATTIAVNFAKHTPDFLKLAATITKINLKVAEHALDPDNRQIMEDAAEHIKQGMAKFKELPKVIIDTTMLMKDVGILVTEGTTCIDTLVVDIEEGVEGVVEALGGVAACTTGAGCLEELLTVKSVAVGAVSTVASDASCALTVANAAKNGAKDVMNLVKLLYSYTDLIDAVISLKDDVVATYEALKNLSDDIKQDMPELEEELKTAAHVVTQAEQEIKKLVPEIRHFASELVLQLKGNINELMYCKSEVGYIFKLGAYTLKDGFGGTVKAAAHMLRAEKALELAKKEFEDLDAMADKDIDKRIGEIKHHVSEIMHNPLSKIKEAPEIIKEIAELPTDITKDLILTSQASLKNSVQLIKHHQDEARKEINKKDDYGGIEKVQKPKAPHIEGDDLDEGMEKAKGMLKKLNTM